MKRTFFPFFAVLFLFAGLGLFRPPLAGVPQIQAVLAADPANVTAYCPAKINFKGAIKVSGPCKIQYRIVRSDGVAGPSIALFCQAAGIYPVTSTWKLSSSYSGWEAIEILSPVSLQSLRANFSLTCEPKPVINWENTSQVLVENGDFYIDGQNFGASQGTRNVTLDGQPALPRPGWTLKQWSDHRIVINVRICDLVLWDHTYNIAITEGGSPVSDIYPYRFSYPMCAEGGYGQTVLAGHEASFKVWNLPPSQAGFTLAISPGEGFIVGQWTPIPIVGWQGAAGCTPGTIKATIPLGTSPSAHMLFLLKNGTWCSSDGSCLQINVVLPKIVPLPIKK